MLWAILTASMRAVLGHGEYITLLHIYAVGLMGAKL